MCKIRQILVQIAGFNKTYRQYGVHEYGRLEAYKNQAGVIDAKKT